MPLRRARTLPAVTIHRDTILNTQLSPTSRLLYAVLLASLDGDLGLEKVASLAGVPNVEALNPYLEELEAVGVVEMGEHASKGSVLTVNELPAVPAQRTHACAPCQECGDCSCNYIKGICQPCYYIRDTFEQARTDIAHYKARLADGATYAIGSNGTRLHRWDCPTLNTPEKGMARLEEQKPDAKERGVYWSRLPVLYTAEELRRKGTGKKHCATCGPDPL